MKKLLLLFFIAWGAIAVAQNSVPTNISLSNNTMPENSSPLAFIGKFTTVDPDPDTHTYTFEVSGADNGNFIISNDSLFLNTSLDYEVKSSHLISIQTDDGNGGIYFRGMTVWVSNVNEGPTLNGTSLKNIDEGTQTAIGGVSISDPDINLDSLNITMVVRNGTFNLANTTGINFLYGDGVNDDSLSAKATLADINTALNNFNYTSTTDYVGADSIYFYITDNGSTGSGGPQSILTYIPLAINARAIVFTTNPSSATVCEGTPTFLYVQTSGTNTITYQWTFNGSNIVGATNDTLDLGLFDFGENGNYRCIATNGAGASLSSIAVLSIRRKPVSSFTATEVCFGGSNTLTNSSTIPSGTINWFKWDFGDGSNQDSTNSTASHAYSSDGVYNVTLYTRSDFGCLDTIVNTVNCNPNPVAYFKIEDICFVDSLTPQNLSAINSGTMSYSWDWGDSNNDTGTNPTHRYTSTDVYTVRMVATSNKGCVRSHDTVITINPSPTANFIALNACDSTDVLFEEVSSISTGTLTNQWILGDGTQLNNITDPTHKFVGAGTYQNKLIVTSDKNCIDSITKDITIYANPDIQPSITDVKCFGNADGVLQIKTNVGKQPFIYSIDNGNWQFLDYFTGLTAKTYQVKVLDNNNCETTKNITVTQPPRLEEGITEVQDALCYGETSGELKFNPIGGTTPYSYFVNLVDNEQEFSAASLVPSNHLTKLAAKGYPTHVVDKNNCRVFFVPVVNHPSRLELNKTFTNVSCKDGNDGEITLVASGSHGSYEYSIDNGSSFQTTGNYNNLNAQNYLISVKDKEGCSLSEGITIGEPSDSLKIWLDDIRHVKCYGKNTGKAVLGVSGGSGIKTFGIIDSSHTQTDFTFKDLPADTFNFSVTDEKGCIDSIEVEIKQPSNPTTINFNRVDLKCAGTTTGSINMVASGGTSPYLYSLNGSLLSSTQKYDGLAAKKHFVKLIDGNNCEILDSFKIMQPEPISYKSLSHIGESCEGDSTASLSIVPDGGYGNKMISFDEGPFSNNGTYTKLVSKDYKIVLKDDSSCTWDTTITISAINYKPNVNFSYVHAKEAVIFDNKSSNADSYLWLFGDGDSSASINPIHVYDYKQKVQVWLVAENSCGKDSSSKWINLNDVSVQGINKDAIAVYPNPANNVLFVKNLMNDNWNNSQIIILDVHGKRIHIESQDLTNNGNMINIERLPAGYYSLIIQHESKQLVAPFVKRK